MARPADYLTYYQIAKNECEIIMQHQSEHNLNPSFKAVFKDALCQFREEPNGEVIWEVGMAGGASNFGDSKLGYYNGNWVITMAPDTWEPQAPATPHLQFCLLIFMLLILPIPGEMLPALNTILVLHSPLPAVVYMIWLMENLEETGHP